MSNATLVRRIEEALAQYLSGGIERSALISAIEENATALEMMPYHLIKEINEIEYRLTVAQWADEDDFLPNEAEVLNHLSRWICEVPKGAST